MVKKPVKVKRAGPDNFGRGINADPDIISPPGPNPSRQAGEPIQR